MEPTWNRRTKRVIHRSQKLLKANLDKDFDSSLLKPINGNEPMGQLPDTAIRNRNADSWSKYREKSGISPTLASLLESSAEEMHTVWASLAGDVRTAPACRAAPRSPSCHSLDEVGLVQPAQRAVEFIEAEGRMACQLPEQVNRAARLILHAIALEWSHGDRRRKESGAICLQAHTPKSPGVCRPPPRY